MSKNTESAFEYASRHAASGDHVTPQELERKLESVNAKAKNRLASLDNKRDRSNGAPRAQRDHASSTKPHPKTGQIKRVEPIKQTQPTEEFKRQAILESVKQHYRFQMHQTMRIRARLSSIRNASMQRALINLNAINAKQLAEIEKEIKQLEENAAILEGRLGPN